MNLSFQFTVAKDYETVADAIRKACAASAKKHSERPGGEFTYSIKANTASVNFVLYLSEAAGVSTVRIMSSGIAGYPLVLRAHDAFLEALENTGLEIPVVPGTPYIVTAMQMSDGLEQQFTSKKQFSAGGALMGGMLFGDLGAVVGGYNGKTKGKTKTTFSNSVLFVLCYSNGMIEEREVKKNTKLYAEVMAKLNADPVIHKSARANMERGRKVKPVARQTLPLGAGIAIGVIIFITILLCIIIVAGA